MNLPKTCILTSILLLCSTAKLQAEFVSVVELTDLRGNVSFQICTEEEKKKNGFGSEGGRQGFYEGPRTHKSSMEHDV